MKKRENRPAAIGGSALLVIFAVLCLTVLALLSLSTALAEKRIADSSARWVTAYYEADLQAQRMFARLRQDEQVPGVETDGTRYRYSCPISSHQRLEVELSREDGDWKVVSWRTAAQPETQSDTLPVWQGPDQSTKGGTGS